MGATETFSETCVTLDGKSDLLTVTVTAQERKHKNSNDCIVYLSMLK